MKIFKYLFIFLILIKPSLALELKGDFKQGSLIIGKTNPKFEVYVQGKKVKINQKGFFVFGISRDQIEDIIIETKNRSNIKKTVKNVKKRKFKIQRIDGLPKRKVTPNEEDMKRIRYEGKLISKAKRTNSDLSYFFEDFIRPVKGITTGVFGSQRHGLISIYSHLDKIFVKKGKLIKKGQLIATVGSTGRSTGPHLDFRLYCRNVPVDPDLVIKKN